MPHPTSYPGYFIAIEGIDGAGKSTLAHALADALRRREVPCTVSFEPTKGPFGQRIRELATEGRGSISAEEELDLFVADRRQHVAEVVRPALERGDAIILDRYYYSTVAYQGARGIDAERILALHSVFAPEPHLLVMVQVELQTALDRIRRSRRAGPDLFEQADTLERVAENFARITHPNLLCVDGTLATEVMVDRILSRMEPWLASRSRS